MTKKNKECNHEFDETVCEYCGVHISVIYNNLIRERDEARERWRSLDAGEVVTKGIAALVDRMTQVHIEKVRKAQAERDEARAVWITGICSEHQEPDPLCRLCNQVALAQERQHEAEKERDALRAEVERLKEHIRKGDRFIGAVERADAAEAEVERLRGLLSEAEWAVTHNSTGSASCPWCHYPAPRHRSNCPAFSARGEVRLCGTQETEK